MYKPSIFNKPALKLRRRELRRNSTDAEKKLWLKLRAKQLNGFKFYRQFAAEHYILDFYCPSCRLAVELDGSQHVEEKQLICDEKRTRYLNRQNIQVIRFWDNDIFKNIDGVLREIEENLTPPALPLK